MNVKSIAAALGFVAALTAFSAAPARANVSTDTVTQGAAALDDLNLSGHCTCGYVRYYRVYRVYRVQPVYRVYRVRYYI
ncbi:MAG: hypothetical protein K2Y71_13590 [Xanthobacteraceae bacterium]|nr:hypothetical protein [Xanthobacteraceae bacterium]